MHKQQIIIISTGLALLLGLYLFGPTVAPEKRNTAPAEQVAEGGFEIVRFQTEIMERLSEAQKKYVQQLQTNLSADSDETEKHRALHLLSSFWKDSIPIPPLHYFYAIELAKLDNTEKSLTFAAHSILGYLPFERNHDIQHWLATRGKELFEKALVINSANDSTIIGVAGCLMYGADAGGEDNNPMAGILKVREVADRDSTNMFAQYMLGVGGLISKQFDRAAQRFEKVAKAQPDNIEVMFKLAEAHELANNNEAAVFWYNRILQKVENPEMRVELTKRISMLKSR